MEPDGPDTKDKKELRPATSVEVADKPAPGRLEQVRENVKQELDLLKDKLSKQTALEELEGLKDPTKSQIYKSIFRVKHDESPRSRSLGVLTNVFLHLHPAKINRDAVRFSYTWGMGGITFYLFIVLTFTGILLIPLPAFF
jgi:hypothetical protein